MTQDLRRALGFAVRFLPVFLVLLGLYLKVLPWYRVVPERLANSVMAGLSPVTRIEALPSGGWRAYVQTGPDERRVFIGWRKFVVHLLFLNLVLLPALVLATPAPLRDRLRLAALALPLLVAVQALCLIGLVRGQLCLESAPRSFVCLWLLRAVYASGQLSAAALWALLTWRFWLPEKPAQEAGGRPGEPGKGEP